MEKVLKLQGLNVVSFESRLADTMSGLIRLQGGLPFSAPSMKEVPLENNPAAFLFGEKLLKGEIASLILLTGVGTKVLLSVLETRHAREKILDALRKINIIPRGPKSVRVLKEIEVPFTVLVPEPNTWREILGVLDAQKEIIPLKNKTIAVQEYGLSNPELLAGLRERGAKVLEVPVYRWALPDDIEPLKNAITKIVSGGIDVAIFTTAIQIEHVFQVAEKMKLEKELQSAFRKVVVASVGPDCSQALESRGLCVDIQPESSKMSPLVLAAAEKAREILEKKRK